MTARGAGAFGKMPGMGDFLRLDLPAGFTRAWDAWLQAGLISARDRLGERWNACYLSAPIWRFSLPPGVAGAEAISGVTMPSVDRVGRQYPLTLAAPCGAGPTALRHFANDAFFTALEDIALTALEEELSRDALAALLEGCAPANPDAPAETAATYAGACPPEAVLAARWLRERHGETCVWTAAVAGDHRLFLSPGLPDPLRVEGLFDLDAPVWRALPAASPA
jgi:type VI secretion system protein ImpM